MTLTSKSAYAMIAALLIGAPQNPALAQHFGGGGGFHGGPGEAFTEAWAAAASTAAPGAVRAVDSMVAREGDFTEALVEGVFMEARGAARVAGFAAVLDVDLEAGDLEAGAVADGTGVAGAARVMSVGGIAVGVAGMAGVDPVGMAMAGARPVGAAVGAGAAGA